MDEMLQLYRVYKKYETDLNLLPYCQQVFFFL